MTYCLYFVHNVHYVHIIHLRSMKIVSITEGRKKLGELVDIVKYQKQPIALGKHGRADAFLVASISEEEWPTADMLSASSSFDFLKDEPDLYTRADLKKKYD